MPSPYIKKLSKMTGKSIRELEKDWEEAKQITADFFGKKEKDFGDKEYAYATSIVKKMNSVNEDLLDVTRFLNSELSAKEYIEQISGQTSGDFDIGNVKPPEKKDKKKKKDAEDETEEACDKKKKESEEEDEELGEHIANLNP